MALETTRLRAEQQEVIRELSVANDELRRGRAVLEWAERQHHQLMQLVLDEVKLPELTCSATCSGTAVRSGPGRSSTGRRRSGTTCPGRTSWRC